MDVRKYFNAAIRDIPLPQRMERLPISDKGFPVPWFVAKVDGAWDFRVIEAGRIYKAYTEKLCWLCGQKLGAYLAFTIGPMCSITRTTSEPPSHLDCAQYAVRTCPFLSKPKMRRNEVDLPEHPPIPGEHISHNPGAVAIWIAKGYSPFKANGGTLFEVGEPVNVLWYAEGRPATRGEVLEAIYKGLPTLREKAHREGWQAELELLNLTDQALARIPKEDGDARPVRQREPDRESVGGGGEDAAADRGAEPR